MKTFYYLLLILFVFTSCIEDSETVDPNFKKVFGFNGNSRPVDISENSDGSFSIYGWAERTVMDMENYKEFSKEARMPIIMKIDQDGNEIVKRMYPIDPIEYEFHPAADLFDIKINWAEFTDVKELNNGNSLALFKGYGDSWLTNGFMLLDEKLNMEKVQLLEDFEMEFQDTPFVGRFDHKIFNSPTENEVLLLATESYYTTPEWWNIWETAFYSIFRLSMDGNLLNLYDYDMNEIPILASDMIFDAEGNALVVGQIYDVVYGVFIHKIDLQTGDIINEVELITDSNVIYSPKILATENGFVLGAIEEAELPRLSISFLDQDFNFINRISYPVSTDRECSVHSFIPMTSGGFCFLTSTCNGVFTILRVDSGGNEIWRRSEERFISYDGRDGKLIEASDGGILFLRSKGFNSSIEKITLTKFDANGN